MSVLRAAAVEGLRRAARRRRLVVAADPRELARARAQGKLVIDARDVAAAVAGGLPRSSTVARTLSE